MGGMGPGPGTVSARTGMATPGSPRRPHLGKISIVAFLLAGLFYFVGIAIFAVIMFYLHDTMLVWTATCSGHTCGGPSLVAFTLIGAVGGVLLLAAPAVSRSIGLVLGTLGVILTLVALAVFFPYLTPALLPAAARDLFYLGLLLVILAPVVGLLAIVREIAAGGTAGLRPGTVPPSG